MENLNIQKVAGSWRVWINGCWYGNFQKKERAAMVVEQMKLINQKYGVPISIHAFDLSYFYIMSTEK